jgi:hypothetical protein
MTQISAAQNQFVSFSQLGEGLTALEDRIARWAGDQNAFDALLGSLFCSESSPSEAWHQAARDLRQRMIGGGLAIPLSLSSDGTLGAQGIRAGYIGQVPSTQSGQSFAESSNHEQLQGTSFADKATAELPFGIN